MLRELMIHDQKSADATYTANAAMKTGMAVVKDLASHKAKFPAAATADNLLFVQKARIPTGVYAAYTNLSDYDDIFVNVAAGELVVLHSYDYDETFGTDAFDESGLTDDDAGSVVVAGTDGLLVPATSTTKSKYLFEGFYNDAGHTLAQIRVLDTPIANS